MGGEGNIVGCGGTGASFPGDAFKAGETRIVNDRDR